MRRISKSVCSSQAGESDSSHTRTIHWPIAVAAVVLFGVLTGALATAHAQETLGPPDDPYVPAHTIDKQSVSRSILNSVTPSKGTSVSQIVPFNVARIDPSYWPEIHAYVEVLDENGQSVPDLDADSFCVRQDLTDIASFSVTELPDNCATSICLVIDISASMEDEGKLDSVKIAAHEFVNQMSPLDRLAIVIFNNCFQVLQDFTSDKGLLHSKIDQPVGGGGTAVFDGIWKGVDLTSTEVGTKAVIALSDGMENRSWVCSGPADGIEYDDWTNDSTLIVGLARTVGVPIYTISIGDTFDPYYLSGFAAGSGGSYYQTLTAGQILPLLSDIKNRLCSHYLIRYVSPDPTPDGSCHDLVICKKDEAGGCDYCGQSAWCEPIPPVITVDPLPCQPGNQDVEICAEVTDLDTPPDELTVRLFYRNSSDAPFTGVAMAYESGVFCATVPGSLLPCGGADVQYYITADDGISGVASPPEGPKSPYTFAICPNSAPVCSAPSDQTIVQCDPEEVCFPFSASDPDDNLLTTELTYNGATVTIPSSGYQWCYTPSGSEVVDVTLRSIDACGAACELTTRFTFVVDQPPTLTCPQDVTYECGAVGDFGLPAGQDENPSTVTLSMSQDSIVGSCDQAYTLLRTWTATDECGKTVQCTQTITVDDQTPPSITCPFPLTVACPDEIPDPDVGTVVASDDCGGVVTVTHEGDSPLSDGVITRTYRATDLCGNFSECTQTIDVDSLAPLAITCPLPRTVQCAAEIPLADVNAVTVTGDCAGTATVIHVGDVSDGQSCPETIIRTYRVTDAFDNTAECSQILTVDDTTPPSIVCPSPITVACADEIPDPDISAVTASDNCAGPVEITWAGDSPLTGSCPATVTRTYQATDQCGNVGVCTQTITVDDTTPPVIAGVGPDDGIECPDEPVFSTPTASDNCDPTPVLTFEDQRTDGVCANEYAVTRTWTATDACGNTTTASQTIEVRDLTPPSITCPDPIIVACDNEIPGPDISLVLASDDCGGPITVTHEGDGPLTDGVILRTYRATDICGNFSECTQTIDIDSTTALAIACPPSLTVECVADVPAADIASVTVTGDCSETGTVTHVGDVSDGLACPETITRTYRVDDALGNTAECTQTITVDDTTPPEITCPGPLTVSCPDEIPLPDISAVTASDNCESPVEIAWIGDGPLAGSCPATMARTYQATDACGNVTECTQTITVDDTTPPEIAGVGADAEIECPDQPTFSDPTTSDNCDPAPVLAFEDQRTDGLCASEYSVTRTWTATDSCGNSSTASQTISVVDQTPPSIACPGPLTVACISEIPDPSINTVIASDDCGGTVTVTYEGDGPLTDGVILRTYRATDECGNYSDCSQTITVDDTAPLAITCSPSLTVECAADVPVADVGSVIVTGDCSGTATVTHVSDISDGSTCPEIITRTYQVTDGVGNTAECAQTITVDDTTPPVIVGVGADDEIECPSQPVFSDPTVSDNCDAAPNLAFEDQRSDGSCANEYSVTRTWTATDACGNSSTASQTISIHDQTPPSITCPDPLTVDCLSQVPDPDVSAVIATDDCEGTVIVTQEGDSPLTDGVILRTYRATDECGNYGECVQTIIVDGTTTLAIACPGPVTIECAEDIPAADIVAVTVTGDCDGTATVTHVGDVSDGLTCPETITRTYRATDASGNTAECSQTITVDDITPPVISGIGADGEIECPDQPVFSDPTVSDNCDPAPTLAFEDQRTDGQCANEYAVTRTWTATDACGNSSTASQTINVYDHTPPSITCPVPLTVACVNEVPAPDISAVTASDDCEGPVTVTHEGDSPLTDGVILRTYRATDECGNDSECVQTINVDGTTILAIDCPGLVTVECAEEIPAADIGSVTVTGDCDGTAKVTHVGDVSDGQACPETITRTYRATDALGNTAECTQLITVDDTTPPAITCPGPLTVACPDEVPSPDIAAVSASDNCGGSVDVLWVSDNRVEGACPVSIARTYQATDVCGNVAECTQTITVDYSIPLSIQCQGDTTVTVSPQASGAVVEFVATVTPSCAGAVAGCEPPSGSFFPLGNTTVICTAADACTTATCIFTVTVERGVSPPVVRVPFDIKPQSCPNPLNVKLNGGNSSSSAGIPSEQSGNSVLPTAILGTAEFDVTTIDPTSLRLKGIPPLRWNYEDVATPLVEADECACSSDGADGFTDLTVKFSKDDIIAAIGPVSDGDELVLTITGTLLDGADIVGADCVVIRGMRAGAADTLSSIAGANDGFVTWSHPNPFNGATAITFELNQAGHVDIEVYDILGHRVVTLLDDFRPAGRNTVIWNGRTSAGDAVASGVYFYRIQSGSAAVARKMVLLK